MKPLSKEHAAPQETARRDAGDKQADTFTKALAYMVLVPAAFIVLGLLALTFVAAGTF